MSTVVVIVRELVGLFIDDGSLAIAVIVVMALAALSASVGTPTLVTGGILLSGCLLALGENLRRTTRKDRERSSR
jgi:hypothetical protein